MTLCTSAPYFLAETAIWCSAALPVFFLLYAVLTGFLAYRNLKGEGRGNILPVLLHILFMGLLLLTHGPTMSAVKGFLLFQLLFQASVSDIRTHQVPDSLSVMILLTALIDVQLSDLPTMLIGLLVVGIPQLIVAAARPGSYGGADIKITAACAFLMGPWKGLFAMIVGMIVAIVVPVIVRTLKKQSLKEGIPMIPYLSIGILLAFIL